jgi:hypothetical protein
MSIEGNFHEEENLEEMNAKEAFAPYELDLRDEESLTQEEMQTLDQLLKNDTEEMFAVSPEERVIQNADALYAEAQQTIDRTPSSEGKEKARAKANAYIPALLAGGLAFFGPNQDAEAKNFDLGDMIRQEAGQMMNDYKQIEQQKQQARINAERQLRNAQLNYNRQILYINGQLVALDNPRLDALAARQQEMLFNYQYQQEMARAKTPEQQKEVTARLEAQKAQAEARRQMTKQQQRLMLEQRRIDADMNFERQKEQIKADYVFRIEQIKSDIKARREQRRYQY